MLKTIPVAAFLVVLAGGAIGFKSSGLITEARISQSAYLCNKGYGSSCYRLAELTNGQCASPGGMIHGCKYDSRVTVNT